MGFFSDAWDATKGATKGAVDSLKDGGDYKDAFKGAAEGSGINKEQMEINHHLRQVVDRLDDNVKARHIDIESNKPSQLAEFIQIGLNKMGHNLTVDGEAGPGTVAALNTALSDIDDKHKDIDNITQLNGDHLSDFVKELRSRDILDSGTPEMLKEMGQALREIDNKDLQGIADKYDPEGKAPDPQSSIDGTLDQVADPNQLAANEAAIDVPKMG